MNLKKSSSLLESLNDDQKKAVLATHGRVLVLAGAGSGKTKVIIHRIAYLINEHKIPPENILGLTFTNKAAKEMKERLHKLVGGEAKKVTLSTFHSFCMQLLRKEIELLGFNKNFTLYDEQDIFRLSTQLATDILKTSEIPSMASSLQTISYAKNRGISVANMESKENEQHKSFLSELDQRLNASLRAYNAVNFDSLITLSIELFEKNKELLNRYQERFQFIMIDEYQDTNPAQYRLAELLSSKSNNLCVVGDDDQSIYEWRGAEVSHILQFKADEVIKLEQNYRSTPFILEAANQVIAKNKNRHLKQLWTSKKEGEKIVLFHTTTDVEEAQAVVKKALQLKEEKKLEWRDIAILYRSNAISRNFEIALNNSIYEKEGKWVRGIPYEVFGGLEFNLRSEIKDLNAYLRVIANPLDEEALLRIINVPRRGISDVTLDALTTLNRKENIPLWNVLEQASTTFRSRFALQDRAFNHIDVFVALILKAQQHFFENSLTDALKWLLNEINYKKAIEEESKNEKTRIFKWENVQEFVNSAAQYESCVNKEEQSLLNFLSATTLKEEDPQINYSTNKLKLMTFHSAKGLEFSACFLVALEDHILPHERSLKDRSLEEERRLFYVGITRAKEFLTLSMARSRQKMGEYVATNPSRFLFDIPKSLLDLASSN
jgi:DNA helicase II / ATP-dependent DNA helicase PcrA